MRTEQKLFASFLAAAVWADGEFDEYEKEFVAELAEELELNNLVADVETLVKEYEAFDGDKISDALATAATKVDKDEREGILSLTLQLMCADAYLGQDEIENYFAFAEILGVEEDRAEELMDEFLEDDEDLIVEQ